MEKDEVVRQLDDIGKYKVRLLRNSRGLSLDIREYVESEKFQGFTRRGVRIPGPRGIRHLADTLASVCELIEEQAGIESA